MSDKAVPEVWTPRFEDYGSRGWRVEGEKRRPIARRLSESEAHVVAASSELLAVCEAIESHCKVENDKVKGNLDAHMAEGRALRIRLQSVIGKARKP